MKSNDGRTPAQSAITNKKFWLAAAAAVAIVALVVAIIIVTVGKSDNRSTTGAATNSEVSQPGTTTDGFSWTNLQNQYSKDFSVKCKDLSGASTMCIFQLDSAAQSLLIALDDAPSGRAKADLKVQARKLIDSVKEYKDNLCQTKPDDLPCGMKLILIDTQAEIIRLQLDNAATGKTK